jgi:hypothetical protein
MYSLISTKMARATFWVTFFSNSSDHPGCHELQISLVFAQLITKDEHSHVIVILRRKLKQKNNRKVVIGKLGGKNSKNAKRIPGKNAKEGFLKILERILYQMVKYRFAFQRAPQRVSTKLALIL